MNKSQEKGGAAPEMSKEESFKAVVGSISQTVLNLVIRGNKYGKNIDKNFPDSKMVSAGISALTIVPGEKMMEIFFTRVISSAEIENGLLNKNKNFFIESADKILPEYGKAAGTGSASQVDSFRLIFTTTKDDGKTLIEEKDERILWTRFRELVRRCINYYIIKCETEKKTSIVLGKSTKNPKDAKETKETGITISLDDLRKMKAKWDKTRDDDKTASSP